MKKVLVVLGLGLLLGLALGQEAEAGTGGNRNVIGVVYRFMCQMFRCKSLPGMLGCGEWKARIEVGWSSCVRGW